MIEVKVTAINNRYHARLLQDGKPINELSCKEKDGIGWMCRELMRWFNKMGMWKNKQEYDYSHASRVRGKNNIQPKSISRMKWYSKGF